MALFVATLIFQVLTVYQSLYSPSLPVADLILLALVFHVTLRRVLGRLGDAQLHVERVDHRNARHRDRPLATHGC